MTAHDETQAGDAAARKRALDKRLDAIGWGLFFVMIGVLWLVPDDVLTEDQGWLAAAVGVGVILLGVNWARYVAGIKPSGGAIILGLLALAWGITGFYGIELPFFAILFVLIGLAIIFFSRRGSWRCGSD